MDGAICVKLKIKLGGTHSRQILKNKLPQNEKNELNSHKQLWWDKIFVLGVLQNIRLMGMHQNPKKYKINRVSTNF